MISAPTPKQMIALRVLTLAGACWAIDAYSKYWATTFVPPKGLLVIRDFLYFFVGINHGGSNGVPADYMEYCLAIPATVMFLIAIWLGRRLRAGKHVSIIQQLGFGSFLGGALANWSERVIHGGVTDFIFLKPFGFCIFNLADLFIDLGYTLIIVDAVRTILAQRKLKQVTEPADQMQTS